MNSNRASLALTSAAKTIRIARKNSRDQLSALIAGDFDQIYPSDMMVGHKQAIARFEKEAKNGTNAKVKA